MSIKSTALAIGIITLILVAIGYFYGEDRYRAGVNDTITALAQDSTTVDTLTIVKYKPVYINIHHYAQADVDTVNESLVFSTKIDTSVVMGTDTVAVLKQDISFNGVQFDILTDLLIKPVEKLIEVTKTEFRTVIKEVTVSEFPNTWLTGFITGIISFLLLVIFI